MTDYVIEMDERADYGTIHKAGCQHVKDPMPVDNDDPDDVTGWGIPSDEYHRAPCVKPTTCGAEVGVDWINGLVLHEGDTDWHPWDPAIYE